MGQRQPALTSWAVHPCVLSCRRAWPYAWPPLGQPSASMPTVAAAAAWNGRTFLFAPTLETRV